MFIMYGVGAAAVIGGGVLYLMGRSKGKRAERRMSIAPSFGRSSTAILLRGCF